MKDLALLLLSNLIVALGVALFVLFIARKALQAILATIVEAKVAAAWFKTISIVICIGAASSGVRRFGYGNSYIDSNGDATFTLSSSKFSFEIYRTVIETFGNLSLAIFVFLIFALIAYAIVRVFGKKSANG